MSPTWASTRCGRPSTSEMCIRDRYDYVVDAIDTVTGKIALVVKAKEAGTPIICAMGAGTVSYTHLDVYKRQRVSSRSCSRWTLNWVTVRCSSVLPRSPRSTSVYPALRI